MVDLEEVEADKYVQMMTSALERIVFSRLMIVVFHSHMLLLTCLRPR